MPNLICLSRAMAGAALSVFSCFAAAAGPAYTVSTVAGSSLVGDGGLPLAAQLSDAEGLALDHQGNVYIADANNHRVRKVTAAGVIRTLAGTGFPGFSGDGGPGVQAQLNSPYGVAADAAGNVYIADLANNRVRKVWPDGTITTVAGSGQAGSTGDSGPASTAQLNGPRNVAVDSQGNLYISEFYGHRIRIVTPDGSIQTLAGTGSPGSLGDNAAATAAQLSYPAGIAIDFAGVLYITDSGNLKIRRVVAGVISTLSLSGFTLTVPTGVASDGAGGIYIADSGGKRVLRRTASGTVFIAAGVGSAAATPLDSARDVAADAFGELFIADGHRVRLIQSSGYATIFAGDGTFGFRGDGGPAVSAVLNGPAGVAVDMVGNLYVADTLNHRVRKVTANGFIATFAGTGVAGDSADGLMPTSTALDAPQGLFLDTIGALWIDEYFGERVRRLTASGSMLTMAGSGTAGFNGDSRPAISAQLQAPGQAATDAAGNLYIADSGNNRIRKVTPSGIISTYAGTGSPGFSGDGGQAIYAQLNLPRGVALDSAGNLYIADTANNCIRMVQPGGLIATIAGGGLNPLSLPLSVMVGSDQNIYIADTGNNRIVVLTPAGNLSTIAGTGAAGFTGDNGDSLAAQFNNPAALAMDTAGAIYIADSGNNRIRKLSANTGEATSAPATLLSSAGLMNAASMQGGPVAPGEIVSIFATGLGPAIAVAGVFDSNGMLGNLISGTQVLFDGRAAPLLLAQQGQINAQVPYEVAGLSSTHMQVYQAGTVVVDLNAPVAAAAPGLFALVGATGQALAFNQDGSPNGPASPAGRGSTVTIFSTGEGQTNPAGVDGMSSVNPYPQPVGQLVVVVGGRPAPILFAAEAAGQAGVAQFNIQIPGIVSSGAVPVALTVNGVTSQFGVTVFVR